MKYKFRLLILLNLFSLCSFAQSKDKKSVPVPYIAIEGGLGIPEASFKNNFYAGIGEYALLGMNVNVMGAYPISHSDFEIIGNLGFNLNKFDLNAFVSQQYDFFNTPISGTSYTIENLIGGIGYRLPLNSKLSFGIKALAGVCLFSTPDVQYSGVVGRGDKEVLPSNTFIPLLKLGLDVFYAISNKLDGIINFDILYSFSTIIVKEEDGYPPNWSSYSNVIPITVLLVETNIGIAYKFGK